MGKSLNINTYSQEYDANVDSYQVKNVKRGKKKKVTKFKKDYQWEDDRS